MDKEITSKMAPTLRIVHGIVCLLQHERKKTTLDLRSNNSNPPKVGMTQESRELCAVY